MADTIHVRGEGGTVWEMDLPLRPDHAERLADGRLTRVNADGSSYAGAPEPDSDPADDDQDGDDDQPPELEAFLAEPPSPPAKPSRTAKTSK